jgi:serine/threonine protein kinase
MNLRHPCIADPIGFVVSLPLQAVKIVRSYMSSSSLSEVISISPEWWTQMAKAKAVAGLVLSLWFAHSLGVLHGHLTGNNILFDLDGRIQIADFCVQCLAEQEGHSGVRSDVGGFFGGDGTPKADVLAFAEIFSEIVSRDSTSQSDGPMFVSEIIEGG